MASTPPARSDQSQIVHSRCFSRNRNQIEPEKAEATQHIWHEPCFTEVFKHSGLIETFSIDTRLNPSLREKWHPPHMAIW